MEKTLEEMNAERDEAIKAMLQSIATYLQPFKTWAEEWSVPAPYTNKVRSSVKNKGGDRVRRLLPRDVE